MLVYKHECIFGVLFGMLYEKKFLFELNTFGLTNTKMDPKLKDWSKGLLAQSIGDKPPNTVKIGISKKTLSILIKRV